MLESSLPKDINSRGSPDVEVDKEWKAKYKFFTIALCIPMKRIEEINPFNTFLWSIRKSNTEIN